MKHLDFLLGLDDDLKQSLIKQLRNLWTHTSTIFSGVQGVPCKSDHR